MSDLLDAVAGQQPTYFKNLCTDGRWSRPFYTRHAAESMAQSIPYLRVAVPFIEEELTPARADMARKAELTDRYAEALHRIAGGATGYSDRDSELAAWARDALGLPDPFA